MQTLVVIKTFNVALDVNTGLLLLRLYVTHYLVFKERDD